MNPVGLPEVRIPGDIDPAMADAAFSVLTQELMSEPSQVTGAIEPRPLGLPLEPVRATSRRPQLRAPDGPVDAAAITKDQRRVEDADRKSKGLTGLEPRRKISLKRAYAELVDLFEAPAKRYDSSVEIEVDLSPKIMRLLTTYNAMDPSEDGTVGALLTAFGVVHRHKDLRITPAKLVALSDQSWDNYGTDTYGGYRKKLKLLQVVSQRKALDWDDDRRIPRVKVKDTIELQGPLTFLGKRYPAGKHTVDVSGVFRDVEYRYRWEQHSVSGVELHLRRNASAGEVANDAWSLLEGLGLKRVPLHVHIVAPLLKRHENIDIAGLGAVLYANRFRMANLLAEFISIMYERSGIYPEVYRHYDRKTGKAESRTMTDHLISTKLSSAIYDLRNWILGIDLIHDYRRNAWVDLRAPSRYDEPDVYGWEYRSITPVQSRRLVRVVLDAVQNTMLAAPTRTEVRQSWQWIGGHQLEEFGRIWYSPTIDYAVSGADPDGKRWSKEHLEKFYAQNLSATAKIPVKLARRLIDYVRNGHAEVDMLMHDWSGDPLLLSWPAALRRVAEAQHRALRGIEQGDKINPVMREFLVRSGLFTEVLDFFGLETDRANRIRFQRSPVTS